MNFKSVLKALIPVFIGLALQYFDSIVALLQSSVAGHPRASVIVGSVVAALLYAKQSPLVQKELEKLSK